MTLLGRLQAVRDGALHFTADLAESLSHGDAAYDTFLSKVDAYIAQQGLPLPPDPDTRMRFADPPSVDRPLLRLDVKGAGLGAVIWATGYAFDCDWIDLPVLGTRGEPRHEHGIAAVPGLYFLGLPWLSRMNSSFLSGVGEDAARLAAHIATRCPPP
jgi:putative flavoprotein involved in K+ transport